MENLSEQQITEIISELSEKRKKEYLKAVESFTYHVNSRYKENTTEILALGKPYLNECLLALKEITELDVINEYYHGNIPTEVKAEYFYYEALAIKVNSYLNQIIQTGKDYPDFSKLFEPISEDEEAKIIFSINENSAIIDLKDILNIQRDIKSLVTYFPKYTEFLQKYWYSRLHQAAIVIQNKIDRDTNKDYGAENFFHDMQEFGKLKNMLSATQYMKSFIMMLVTIMKMNGDGEELNVEGIPVTVEGELQKDLEDTQDNIKNTVTKYVINAVNAIKVDGVKLSLETIAQHINTNNTSHEYQVRIIDVTPKVQGLVFSYRFGKSLKEHLQDVYVNMGVQGMDAKLCNKSIEEAIRQVMTDFLSNEIDIPEKKELIKDLELEIEALVHIIEETPSTPEGYIRLGTLLSF